MTPRDSDVQSRQMFRRGVCFFLTIVASAGAGCSSNSSSGTTTPTSPSIVFQTEAFSGNLDPLGSQLKTFTIANDGTMSVTLASLTTSSNSSALTTPVSLGAGTPNGDSSACVLTSSLVTPPGFQTQISIPVTKATGTYCVSISDPGSLTTTVTFVIRVVHS
jgi:hypothetical protein